jgi:hypothetical protein
MTAETCGADSSSLTAMVCAKLVKELAGKMLASD